MQSIHMAHNCDNVFQGNPLFFLFHLALAITFISSKLLGIFV